MTDTDMIEAMAQTYAAAWRADISEYQGVDVATWDAMSKVQQQAMRRVSKAVALAVVQPEIDKLRAENARLRGALEPFASRAGRYDPVDNDDGEPDWSTAAPSIRIGDLRRARAALEKSNG